MKLETTVINDVRVIKSPTSFSSLSPPSLLAVLFLFFYLSFPQEEERVGENF